MYSKSIPLQDWRDKPSPTMQSILEEIQGWKYPGDPEFEDLRSYRNLLDKLDRM